MGPDVENVMNDARLDGAASALTAMLCRTDPRRFMAIASKPHAQLAGEMADEIKAVIYAYEQRIPLALAIGVLRIIEKEILDAA